MMAGTAEGDLLKLFSLNKGDLSPIFIQRHRLNYFIHTHTRTHTRTHTHTHVCAQQKIGFTKNAKIKKILTSHNIMREKLNEIQITYVIY